MGKKEVKKMSDAGIMGDTGEITTRELEQDFAYYSGTGTSDPTPGTAMGGASMIGSDGNDPKKKRVKKTPAAAAEPKTEHKEQTRRKARKRTLLTDEEGDSSVYKRSILGR